MSNQYTIDENGNKVWNWDKPLADSGVRVELPTGALRETTGNKGRFDLIPFTALSRVAKHFENSTAKYPERNWEKGMPIHICMDSAIRHLLKYVDGQDEEDHLAAAAWNIFCAMHMEERMPEMQDIPSRIKNNE